MLNLRIYSQDIFKTNFLLLFFSLTISFTKTTIIHSELINVIRSLLFILYGLTSFLSIILILRKGKFKLKSLLLIFFSIILISFGSLSAVINGGSDYFDFNFIINLLSTFSSIFSISLIHELNDKDHNFIDNGLAYYFLFLFLLLISCGGILFENFPRFNFEYITQLRDVQSALYSQGTTKAFGFASILFLGLFYRERNYGYLSTKFRLPIKGKAINIFLLFFTLFFFSLCVLGGARGDFIFAFIVLISTSLLIKPFKSLTFFILLILSILFFISRFYSFDELYANISLIRRIAAVTDSNFGDRDILIIKALDIIKSDPSLLIFGKGLNYFQYFYGLEYSDYPHNSIFEFIITFGLPISILFFVFTLRGIIITFKDYKVKRIYYLLFFYLVLLGLKSGAILTPLQFGATLFFFIEGISKNFISRKEIKK